MSSPSFSCQQPFKNILLNCNSHTIQLIHLKYNLMVFSTFPSTEINCKTFSLSQDETPCPSVVTADFPRLPSSRPALTYFPSLWICLFGKFYILPLCIILSRFIDGIACVSTSCVLTASQYYDQYRCASHYTHRVMNIWLVCIIFIVI